MTNGESRNDKQFYFRGNDRKNNCELCIVNCELKKGSLMSLLKNIINGGMLAGKRTYIISGLGILSAIGAYLVGDTNLLDAISGIFPLAAIYFLRKGLEDGK
jgi:hypothetical protein